MVAATSDKYMHAQLYERIHAIILLSAFVFSLMAVAPFFSSSYFSPSYVTYGTPAARSGARGTVSFDTTFTVEAPTFVALFAPLGAISYHCPITSHV